MAKPPSGLRLVLIILFVIFLIGLGVLPFVVGGAAERQPKITSGSVGASGDALFGFTVKDLQSHSGGIYGPWFDGGGPVREVTLDPGDGSISIALCSSELLDAITKQWSSRVTETHMGESPRLFLSLDSLESVVLATTDADPFMARIFAGAGKHELSLSGIGGDFESALLRRTSIEGIHGFSLGVRDYDANLAISIANSNVEPIRGRTGTVVDGATCWDLTLDRLQSDDHSGEYALEGESMRFSQGVDPFLSIKGAAESLSLEGSETDLLIGDRKVSLSSTAITTEIQFRGTSFFHLSFDGEIRFQGVAESVKINGVEKLPREWAPWTIVSREILIPVLASVAGAVAGVGAAVLMTKRPVQRQ